MFLAVSIMKAIVEVMLFAFIAQALLYLFAGVTRDQNIVYRLFAIVTRPVWKATRAITPRIIVDGHVGFVSFFLLSVLWAVLVVAKIYYYINPVSS